MKVHDYPLWAASYSVLICHLIFNKDLIWLYILSGMIFGALYYIIRLISKHNLGIGDVYFGFFQGFCLPPSALPVCLAVETVLALLVMNKKIGHKAFPFIPFMSLGLLTSFIINLF